MLKKYFPLFLLLTFHLFLLIHLKFTAWPEMFSYPYLKNHHFLLYKDMVHPYPPLLTLTLAYIFRFLGYRLEVLQSLAWIIILFSSTLVYLTSLEITKNKKASVLASLFYVVFQPFLDGNMLWFDIAAMPLLLLGAVYLVEENLFLSGLFFSAAGFVKQTGGLFYVSFLVYLLIVKTPLKKLKNFLIGPFIFAVPLAIRLWQEGAVIGFWKWVIYYPTFFWSKYPGYVQMSLSKAEWLIVVLTALLPLLFACQKLSIKKDKNFQIITLALILSLAAVYPRFSYFHFQPAFAFSAILLGLLISKDKRFASFLVFSALVLSFLIIRPTLLRDWNKEPRFLGEGEFSLAKDIGMVGKDPVFLQGLPSQLYVLSGTLPPKPWLDNFGWYWEVPGIQEQVLASWKVNPPQVVIWRNPQSGESALGHYAPKEIVNYLSQNYTKEQELEPGIWVWRKNQ